MEQVQTLQVRTSKFLVSWLLEPDDPSVRYYTLTRLLGRDERDAPVRDALDGIGKVGWASRILGRQKKDTYWHTNSSCYTPKFSSCVWQLLVLADLGVIAEDARVKSCINHFFDNHNVETGGFAVVPNPDRSNSFEPHACMSGNAVSMLARMGCGKDSQVRNAVDWLLTQQLDDGGWNCSTRDGGKHGSFHATIEPLWGLSEMLKLYSNQAWRESANKACEFLLRHRLYRSDRDGTIVLLDFLRLHYPVHYRYDILHALRVLTEYGITNDNRMNDALAVLLDKRLEDGSWPLEAVYRGWRLPHAFNNQVRPYRPEELELVTGGWGGAHTQQLEEAGKPSKWLTLQALLVLKRMGILSLNGSTGPPSDGAHYGL